MRYFIFLLVLTCPEGEGKLDNKDRFNFWNKILLSPSSRPKKSNRDAVASHVEPRGASAPTDGETLQDDSDTKSAKHSGNDGSANSVINDISLSAPRSGSNDAVEAFPPRLEIPSFSTLHESNMQHMQRYQQHDEPHFSASPVTSIASAIVLIFKDILTVERCRRAVLCFGAYWLVKKFLAEMVSLLDDIQEELKEDHDNLLFTPDTVANAATLGRLPIGTVDITADSGKAGNRFENQKHQTAGNDREGPKSNEYGKKQRKTLFDPKPSATLNPQNMTPKQRYARDLILKLHAAGLPLEPQMHSKQDTFVSSPPPFPRTAESVLRSLTKAEGTILANCLLLPEGALIDGVTRQIDPIAEWKNIGGLADVKESLVDLVYPLMASPPTQPFQQQHSKNSFYGDLLSHPSGLLLFGPPGCGKSMLAKALAYTAGARFLCVKHSDLLRKYVGETNLKVRALFSLARKIQPCIIFVDEVDGLFRERSSSASGGEEHDVSRDLKTEFMQLWDGISSSKSDKILVMGATNRPFDVDAAFLRRMPRAYFVGLPDLPARIAILQTMLKDVPLSSDFDIDSIARETQGYSPSDLKELLRVAALIPLREARASSMASSTKSNLSSTGSGSPFLQVPNLRLLRPLLTSDVLRARRIVAPTQYSAAYRSSIAEYARRSNGSLYSPEDDRLHGERSFKSTLEEESNDEQEDESSELFSEDDDISSFDDE